MESFFWMATMESVGIWILSFKISLVATTTTVLLSASFGGIGLSVEEGIDCCANAAVQMKSNKKAFKKDFARIMVKG